MERHLNFLNLKQFNILIKLKDNIEYDCDTDSNKSNYNTLVEEVKEIKEKLFPNIGTLVTSRETHQININIAGLFEPKGKIRSDGMGHTREWMEASREYRKENKDIPYDYAFCHEVIKEHLKGIKYSVQTCLMNPVEKLEFTVE